jgi:hypothetical protein
MTPYTAMNRPSFRRLAVPLLSVALAGSALALAAVGGGIIQLPELMTAAETSPPPLGDWPWDMGTGTV